MSALWIVFDLETTGLSVTEDEVTQIAAKALLVDRAGITDLRHSHASYCRTERPISAFVEKLTGILTFSKAGSPLLGAPDLATNIRNFSSWLSDTRLKYGARNPLVLVGHNIAAYDLPLLNNQASRAGIDLYQMLEAAGVNAYLDTLVFLRAQNNHRPLEFLHPWLRYKNGSPNFTQSALFTAATGRSPEGAHRADADVDNLTEILSSPTLRSVFNIGTPLSPIRAVSQKERAKKN